MLVSPTQVVLVAEQHLVRGGVATDGKRLLDLLNDKNSEYLKLQDCALSRLIDPEREVGRWDRGVMPKTNVSVAVLLERHEAPQKRANLLVKKRPFEIFLTVNGYDVRGYVHLERAVDAVEYHARLHREGMNFFPITDAVLTPAGPLGDPIPAPTALVSRHRIGFFFLHDQPRAEEAPPRPMARALSR